MVLINCLKIGLNIHAYTICHREFKIQNFIDFFFVLFQCVRIGKNIFACAICHREFKSKQHVLQHIVVHTGEKPYSCSHCDASFNTKSNCLRHIKRIHPTLYNVDPLFVKCKGGFDNTRPGLDRNFLA